MIKKAVIGIITTAIISSTLLTAPASAKKIIFKRVVECPVVAARCIDRAE